MKDKFAHYPNSDIEKQLALELALFVKKNKQGDYTIKYLDGTWRKADLTHAILWRKLTEEKQIHTELEATKTRMGRDAIRRERNRVIDLLKRADRDFPYLDKLTLAFAIEIASTADAEKKLFGVSII